MSGKKYGLKVIKVPLGRKIRIREIDFPPLKNLELNLLENPQLCKIGVPLIPLKPIKPIKHEFSRETKDSISSSKHKKHKGVDDLAGLQSDTEGESEIEITNKKDELSSDNDLDSESESGSEEEDYEETLSPEELEAQKRSELNRKIKILKKQYPNRTIQEFNEFTDLKTLQKAYDDELWDIHVDESTDSYRFYLMIAFMGMEYLGTQTFGIDVTGLTRHHMRRKEKYDRLLIELGEKSYSQLGANLPVEIRLLGVMLFETLAFYIGKQIFSSGDRGMAQLYSMMAGMEQAPNQGGTSPKEGVRVRGPTITPEEIRNMAKEEI